MSQQNALDAFVQFYSSPSKPPVKSALRHLSYNFNTSDELESEESSDSSPSLQHAVSSPTPANSVPRNLRVSLPVENNIPNVSPRSSPYDTSSLNLKKSTSSPQIPSNVRFGRDSSDTSILSSSSKSDTESNGMERSNSLVILDDFPQEIFINDVGSDEDTDEYSSYEYDDDSSTTTSSLFTLSSSSSLSTNLTSNTNISTSTSTSTSPQATMVVSSSNASGTVRKKSSGARYFPTSEASLEKFFRPPEIEVQGEDGSTRFKKATEDDYAKMLKNPEAYSSSKLAKLHRRHSRKQSRDDAFNPSQETIAKTNVLKQFFYEKHSLIATDYKKYQHDLLTGRGPLKTSLQKKLKKLNINFVVTREKVAIRDRSKSSPPVPTPQRTLSLSEIIARDGGPIPKLMKQALEFLYKEEALNTEGLFRVAGNSYEIDILWDCLADGQSIPANCEVHTVTSVFKRFFRELKEPLFTFKLHKQFLHAVNDDLSESETLQKLKETLNECPEANKIIIKELFQFLKKVIDSNMMHAINLGIVFGPSLLRDDSSTMSMFDNRNQVVSTLLENYDAIFETPADP